jgi:hypothetical protein
MPGPRASQHLSHIQPCPLSVGLALTLCERNNINITHPNTRMPHRLTNDPYSPLAVVPRRIGRQEALARGRDVCVPHVREDRHACCPTRSVGFVADYACAELVCAAFDAEAEEAAAWGQWEVGEWDKDGCSAYDHGVAGTSALTRLGQRRHLFALRRCDCHCRQCLASSQKSSEWLMMTEDTAGHQKSSKVEYGPRGLSPPSLGTLATLPRR